MVQTVKQLPLIRRDRFYSWVRKIPAEESSLLCVFLTLEIPTRQRNAWRATVIGLQIRHDTGQTKCFSTATSELPFVWSAVKDFWRCLKNSFQEKLASPFAMALVTICFHWWTFKEEWKDEIRRRPEHEESWWWNDAASKQLVLLKSLPIYIMQWEMWRIASLQKRRWRD